MAGRLLSVALGIRGGDVVALTGGGGKTTALFRLARELRGTVPPVVTTTTRIFIPAPAADLALVVEAEREPLLAATRAALATGRIPVVGRGTTADGKLAGIPPDWCADLAQLDGAGCLLVEADGSARLPITAPREGEPVIPASATVVVTVVGVDALEGPLSAVAHRPERVAALTGLAADARLDAAAVACVVAGPDGNARGAPPGARVVALVNKADDDERLRAARDIARALRARRPGRVVIAALESEELVREVVGG